MRFRYVVIRAVFTACFEAALRAAVYLLIKDLIPGFLVYYGIRPVLNGFIVSVISFMVDSVAYSKNT